jgi:hypothetical protein
MPQIIIKSANAVQMAVDGLGRKPPIQQMFDIRKDFPAGGLFDRDIQPDHIMLQRIDVVFDRAK